MSNQYFDPIDILGPDFFLNDLNTVKNLVKQRIVVCLFTDPGELWDGDFGVGLRHALFEPNTATSRARITSEIERQIGRYFPYVDLQEVVALDTPENPDMLYISMKMYIPYLNEEIVLNFGGAAGSSIFTDDAFGLNDIQSTSANEAEFYTESGILGITETNYSWDPND